MEEPVRVYRVERPLRYGGGKRRAPGEFLINPSPGAAERLSSHLTRLDEDGRIPRSTLRTTHYQQLQKLAAEGDVDEVDGNSGMETIIDAYALDEED